MRLRRALAAKHTDNRKPYTAAKSDFIRTYRADGESVTAPKARQ